MKLLLNLRPTIPLRKGPSRRYLLAMGSMVLLGGLGLGWTAWNGGEVMWRKWRAERELTAIVARLPELRKKADVLRLPEKVERRTETLLRELSREMELHGTTPATRALDVLEERLPAEVRIEDLAWSNPPRKGTPELRLRLRSLHLEAMTETIRRLSHRAPLGEGELLGWSKEKDGWRFETRFDLRLVAGQGGGES